MRAADRCGSSCACRLLLEVLGVALLQEQKLDVLPADVADDIQARDVVFGAHHLATVSTMLASARGCQSTQGYQRVETMTPRSAKSMSCDAMGVTSISS